eukprot:176196-Rhodomonas_salina.1
MQDLIQYVYSETAKVSSSSMLAREGHGNTSIPGMEPPADDGQWRKLFAEYKARMTALGGSLRQPENGDCSDLVLSALVRLARRVHENRVFFNCCYDGFGDVLGEGGKDFQRILATFTLNEDGSLLANIEDSDIDAIKLAVYSDSRNIAYAKWPSQEKPLRAAKDSGADRLLADNCDQVITKLAVRQGDLIDQISFTTLD